MSIISPHIRNLVEGMFEQPDYRKMRYEELFYKLKGTTQLDDATLKAKLESINLPDSVILDYYLWACKFPDEKTADVIRVIGLDNWIKLSTLL